VEAAAAKPQEDGLGGRPLSCLGSAFFGRPSFLGNVLVEEALAKSSSLLAGMSGLLIEELLAVGNFLAGTSGLLGDEALAMALVCPQFVNCPLPNLVGVFCACVKNGPPRQVRRQQPSGLLVFAEGALMPFLVPKVATNVGWGLVLFIVVELPVGGAWGRLRPFVMQPSFTIGEGGQGQMGRQGSTIPHLWGRREGTRGRGPLLRQKPTNRTHVRVEGGEGCRKSRRWWCTVVVGGGVHHLLIPTPKIRRKKQRWQRNFRDE
jgi:hypothetical protein